MSSSLVVFSPMLLLLSSLGSSGGKCSLELFIPVCLLLFSPSLVQLLCGFLSCVCTIAEREKV